MTSQMSYVPGNRNNYGCIEGSYNSQKRNRWSPSTTRNQFTPSIVEKAKTPCQNTLETNGTYQNTRRMTQILTLRKRSTCIWTIGWRKGSSTLYPSKGGSGMRLKNIADT